MAGRIVRVLERTAYSYTTLTAGQTTDIAVGDVDISAAREVTLLVRVHAASITGAGSKYTVYAKAIAPTNEDPAQDFFDSTTLATSASVVTSTTAYLLRVALPANSGAWIRVFVNANQAAVGTLTATLSIDASLKE
jgi:hypothetical protein